MTLDQVRKLIYDRFIAQWGDRTVYELEGEDFDEPDPGIEWARVSVRETDSGQESIGPKTARKFERNISAFIQIFTPVIEGMQSGSLHGELARNIFEGERLDPQLWLYEGTITDIPVRDGEKSRQTSVEIIGTYEQIK